MGGAVPRFENGWVLGPWGFDSPSFLSLALEAWPSWKGSALLTRRRSRIARRFESCCLRQSPRSSAEKSSGLRTHVSPVRIGPGRLDATSFNGQDARLLPGECWFEPSRRSLLAPIV
jgi:hypothetical protein